MPKLLAALAFVVVGAVASPAMAQVACDASCTTVVDVPTQGAVEGGSVAPGTTVCLRTGGPLDGLQLNGFEGTDSEPITVRPCGSTLEVGTASSGSLGIEIHESEHLRLTGDGGSAAQAIHVKGGSSGGAAIVMGIGFSGCSSDVELDHLEVDGTSYTALRNHVEDPSCAVRSGFSVHDNWFHDLGGEGMFQAINDPTSPYHVADVSVRHNLIERAGYQGIKIGVTVDGCLVEGNVVVDSGFSHTAGEDTGLALGASCTVRANVVLRSSADLVFVRGEGNSYVFENNVFSGSTPTMTFQEGIQDLLIAHNTMVGSSDRAIVLYGDAPAHARVINNLVVAAQKPLDLQSGPALEIAGNVEAASVEAALFSNDATATIPYELESTSPAVDVGVVADGVTTLDFAGRVRDATPDAGAEEFGASLPETGSGGAGASSTTTSGASTTDAATGAGAGGGDVAKTPSDDGGCSFSPGRETGDPSLVFAGVFALAVGLGMRSKRGRR